MNIYLIEKQTEACYGECDSSVVVANNESEAISISDISTYFGITCKLIGVADSSIKESIVILSLVKE
jgi:hypothetical protein